eukprot:359222-Chlamydomonas_euryale.AAC.2
MASGPHTPRKGFEAPHSPKGFTTHSPQQRSRDTPAQDRRTGQEEDRTVGTHLPEDRSKAHKLQ